MSRKWFHANGTALAKATGRLLIAFDNVHSSSPSCSDTFPISPPHLPSASQETRPWNGDSWKEIWKSLQTCQGKDLRNCLRHPPTTPMCPPASTDGFRSILFLCSTCRFEGLIPAFSLRDRCPRPLALLELLLEKSGSLHRTSPGEPRILTPLMGQSEQLALGRQHRTMPFEELILKYKHCWLTVKLP